jgi:hypothetical protein
VFDILAVYRVKKALAKGEIMDGIKNVSLSHPVVPNKAIHFIAEIEGHISVILEVYKGKVL